MDRRNRRLDLERPGPAVALAFSISTVPSAISALVPARPVLVLQQHDLAVGIEPRGGARMLQQQQRHQPHDLGLAGKQLQQQAGEPDRLLAERQRGYGPRRRLPNSLR